MDVRLDDVSEPQSQLADQLQIAVDLFAHGVDQYSLAPIEHEIRVGRALSIEELADLHVLMRCIEGASGGGPEAPIHARDETV
ncbi:MAG: hypothetical protein M4D80_37180 [Myxococcota bacterium]|nr:hypothetical protein [Myxococcota bacterium]